jgi:hypothetical protein
MGTFIPQPKQKQLILNALFYEIEQLIEASSSGIGGSSFNFDIEDNDPYIVNALLESTLLHSRNLLGFFEQFTRHKDDVLAEDFGFAHRTINIDPEYRRRLNKDLSHLTYSRLSRNTLEDKFWDYNQLVYPILDRSKEFFEYLLAGNLPANNEQTIQACKSILEKINWRLQYRKESKI